MKTSDLDYTLPEDLIAQHPVEPRDAARLLVLDRAARTIHQNVFRNIGDYLQPGDCLVLNDTRVIRARIRTKKPTGGRVELFLLEELSPGEWVALVRPSARVPEGLELPISEQLTATVAEALEEGRRRVTFSRVDVVDYLEQVGEIPLPPYIRREALEESDLTRYQTVYAARSGAVAAPTAGLHFTDELLDTLEGKAVRRATVTLHIGYGTFKPIQAERLEDHRVDAEEFSVSQDTAAALNETRAQGGRIVAVGTTATRVLETCWKDGVFFPQQGRTERYIFPPYEFRAVDVLQTNFHLPKSSLLALVCAFGGTEFVLEAYRYAVEQRFRFYSYGDAMLIL